MKKRKNILDFQKFFEVVKTGVGKGGMKPVGNPTTVDKNKNPDDTKVGTGVVKKVNTGDPVKNIGAKVKPGVEPVDPGKKAGDAKLKAGPVSTRPDTKEPTSTKEKKVKIFDGVKWIDEINWKKEPWFSIYQEKIKKYKNPGEGTRERLAGNSAFLLKNKGACDYLFVKGNKRIFGVERKGKIIKKPTVDFPKGEEIDKNSCKKFGEQVKIDDLQKFYYYINEYDTGKFRVIKFLSRSKKGGDTLSVSTSDGKTLKESPYSMGVFYKLDPEEKDEKALQNQDDKLPDDLQALLDKVNKAQSAAELPFQEIRDLFEKYKDLDKGEIEIIDEKEDKKKLNISSSISELGKDLDDLKKESEKKESFYYDRYDKIFEATGGLTGSSTGGSSGGTAGSGGGTGGGTGAGSKATTPPKIREIFERRFKDIEDVQNLSLTQNEVDEMNELLKSGSLNYSLDVSARPDPVVNVVAVFTDAHELYYTDPIPSGRPGGKVSNNTFRQYLKLGKASGSREGTAETPSGSVYAVKAIFNEWKRGVRGLLKDPAYSMISKIKFKIPGKEELERERETKKKSVSDNYSYYHPKSYQLFEEYESGDDKGRLTSTNGGKLLVEFMIRATNPKYLDDFETLCDDLLLNNFGIEKGKYEDSVGFKRRDQTTKEIDIDDIDDKHLKFCGSKTISSKPIELTKSVNLNNIVIMSFECDDGGQKKNYIFCGKVELTKTDKEVKFSEIHFFKGIFKDTFFYKQITQRSHTFDAFEPTGISYADNFGGTDLSETLKFNGILKFDSTKNEMNIDFKNINSNAKFVSKIEKKKIYIPKSLEEQNNFIFIIQEPVGSNTNKYRNYELK